jgi:hypothetical protein
MPATPNRTLPEWHAGPQLSGVHDFDLTPVRARDMFIQTKEEFVGFVLHQCLPEITAYDGFPDLQQEIASEITDSIYDPEWDAVSLLRRYVKDRLAVDPSVSRSEDTLEQARKVRDEVYENTGKRFAVVVQFPDSSQSDQVITQADIHADLIHPVAG